MLKFLLCGFMVAANAAPQYRNGHIFSFDDFEARMDKFWDDFERKFDEFGRKMDTLSSDIEILGPQSGFKGDKYEIEMVLTGLKEDEISVKARRGLVVIEAHSADGHLNVYSSRSLPPNVGNSGDWTYENNVLKIVFPVNNDSKAPVERVVPLDKPNVEANDAVTDSYNEEEPKAKQNRNLADVELINGADISE